MTRRDWLAFALVVLPLALLAAGGWAGLTASLEEQARRWAAERSARCALAAGDVDERLGLVLTELHGTLARWDPSQPSPQPPPWAVALLVAGAHGRILPPAVPLPAPVSGSEEPTAEEEEAARLEFQVGDVPGALASYQAAALATTEPAAAARALVGAIRCRRRLGQLDAAAADVERLARVFGAAPALPGLPWAAMAPELAVDVARDAVRLEPTPVRRRSLEAALVALSAVPVLARGVLVPDAVAFLDGIARRQLATTPGVLADGTQAKLQVDFWTSPAAERSADVLAVPEGCEARSPWILSARAHVGKVRRTLVVAHGPTLAALAAPWCSSDAVVGLRGEAPLRNLPGWAVSLRQPPPQVPSTRLLALGGVALPAFLLAAGVFLLASRARDAVALAELRQRFLAGFSHELRTPLTSLRLMSESLAATDPPPDERRRHLGLMAREAARLEGLLQNVLAYSREAAGAAGPPRRDLVDLDEAAEEALTRLAPLTRERRIVWTPSEEPLTIRGDAEGLTRVVENLMTNALRHGPPDAPVEVGTKVEAGQAVLRVRDHGPGVPPGERDLIFQAFHRGVGAGGEGLGLGLHLARAVVERHGGALTAGEPSSGSGAVFTLTLPLEGS